MRCTTCDYPLWNLRNRTCPECGTPFLPSEHEFVRNSVRFCCPHCDQAYYGTGWNGHLKPSAFDCAQCGRAIEMDEMVLRPAAGVEEEQTQANRMPWFDRRRRGRVKAWLATVGYAMVFPLRLARGIPIEASVGGAWGFAILTLAIIFACNSGIPFSIVAIVGALAGKSDPLEPLIIAAWVSGGGLAVYLAGLVLWGLIAHGALLVTGGATHSIGRTYHALCFSTGAAITTAIPCLGLYPFFFVGLVWWIVSGALMLGVTQQVHGGRAAFAAILFPAIAAISLMTLAFGGVYWGMQQATVAVTQAQAAQLEGGTAIVLSGLEGYMEDHEARGPTHAVELLLGPRLSGLDFIAGQTLTTTGDVPVADTNLDELGDATAADRNRAIEAAAAGQPDGVVAHRVGDFVFTYHGFDLGTAADIWLVIRSPDPVKNAEQAVDGAVVVGLADGSVRTFDLDRLEAELAAQNERRAVHGLPPLPPPREVTHDAPAVP